jgi:hypothetical protein
MATQGFLIALGTSIKMRWKNINYLLEEKSTYDKFNYEY